MAVGRPIGTLTDRSGTITAGGTAQQAAPANQFRKFLLIANPDAATDLFFNIDAVATVAQGSICIAPKASIVFAENAPTGPVSVISATISKPFTVKEA